MSGLSQFTQLDLVRAEIVNGRTFCPVCKGFGKRKARGIRRTLSVYTGTVDNAVLVLCWDCFVGAEVPLDQVPDVIRIMKMPEWLMDGTLLAASESHKQIGD